MTPPPRHAGVRNTAVATGTGALLALLLAQPTSTNSARRPLPAAPPESSVVLDPAGEVVVTGPPVPTDYGPVQVSARLRAGRIVATTAIVHPRANIVDETINRDALPRLEASALAHLDGNVDTVSGATATSTGYRLSLQAAIDAAHRAPSR